MKIRHTIVDPDSTARASIELNGGIPAVTLDFGVPAQRYRDAHPQPVC